LNYLPPIGRIVEMYVEEDDSDGEAYLFARAVAARAGIAGDITLPRYADEGGAQPQTDSDSAQPQTEVGPTFSVSYEPRNFSADDVQTIDQTAPIEVGHHALHADLPPLIWALSISGIGLGWASKSFFEAFLSKLGDIAGSGLTDWLVRSARHAKAAHRTNLVEVRLETTTGVRVTAICPFAPEIGEEVDRLRVGLAALGDVGIFCRTIDESQQPAEMRAATFLWDGTNWRLAWWASDEGVFTTPWFRQNVPDPEQFLGRPLQVGMEALDAMLDSEDPRTDGISASPEVISADARQASSSRGD
jgi:hypothetical protein